MGYLHEGHLSLIRRARQENDRVGISIFVNPIQFNRSDDLNAYPRDLERDMLLLEREGVDLVWTPNVDIVYPPGFQTFVEVKDVTRRLEGAARAGHFSGVTTVVAKLFNVFQPHRVYRSADSKAVHDMSCLPPSQGNPRGPVPFLSPDMAAR